MKFDKYSTWYGSNHMPINQSVFTLVILHVFQKKWA